MGLRLRLEEKIMTKIDVVSGFLGAGKTTLIKKLLKEALDGSKTVLIENEFGEIGIDGGFLKEAGIEIKEMNSGCICCSLVGDFGTSLKEVISTYAPERILIEPSGVGKLSDVLKAVENVAGDLDVEINSAVAVVDASKCKMYMKNFGEFFSNQIEYAGTIILSRTDKVDQAKLNACVEMIREHNDKATIITTPLAQLDGKEVLGTIEGADKLEDMMKEMLEHIHDDHDEDECCGHDHDHEHHHHDHDHDDHDHECGCGHHHDDDEDEHEHHHHHDHDEDGLDHSHCDHEHGHCCHHDHDHEDGEEEYGIGSFVYHRIRPFNQDKLQQFVENWPKSVVRAKGVLWFDDKREDVYVFEQAGVQITATEQGKWLAAFPKKQQKLYLAEYPDMAEKWDEKYGDREIKLVFIGQHMDRHAIVDALDECLSD